MKKITIEIEEQKSTEDVLIGDYIVPLGQISIKGKINVAYKINGFDGDLIKFVNIFSRLSKQHLKMNSKLITLSGKRFWIDKKDFDDNIYLSESFTFLN